MALSAASAGQGLLPSALRTASQNLPVVRGVLRDPTWADCLGADLSGPISHLLVSATYEAEPPLPPSAAPLVPKAAVMPHGQASDQSRGAAPPTADRRGLNGYLGSREPVRHVRQVTPPRTCLTGIRWSFRHVGDVGPLDFFSAGKKLSPSRRGRTHDRTSRQGTHRHRPLGSLLLRLWGQADDVAALGEVVRPNHFVDMLPRFVRVCRKRFGRTVSLHMPYMPAPPVSHLTCAKDRETLDKCGDRERPRTPKPVRGPSHKRQSASASAKNPPRLAALLVGPWLRPHLPVELVKGSAEILG